MCDPGEKASYTMYREFMEEALANDQMSEGEKNVIKRRLKKFFSQGVEVSLKFYSGQCELPYQFISINFNLNLF